MTPDPLSELLSQPKKTNYDSLINKYASKHGLDPDFARRLISQESGGNRRATSWATARGLMQLGPDTVKRFGVKDPYDPDQNLDAGMKYLREHLDEFGDPAKALAAYNAGEGAVRKYGYDRVRKFSNLPKGDKRRGTVNDGTTTGHYVDNILKGYNGSGYAQDPLSEILANRQRETSLETTPEIEKVEPPVKTKPLLTQPRPKPQPETGVTTNDISWHFGMSPDEFKSLSPNKQQAVLNSTRRAMAGDERKKKAGVQLEPSYDYINSNRKSLGLSPKSVMDQTGFPSQEQGKSQYDLMPFLKEVAAAPGPAVPLEKGLQQLRDEREVADFQREADSLPWWARISTQELNRFAGKAERAIAGFADYAEKLPHPGRQEKKPLGLSDLITGKKPEEIKSLTRNISDYLKNRAAIAEAKGNYEPEDIKASLPKTAVKAVADAGMDLASLVAITRSTGTPFPVVMAGEAALNNSDKDPATIVKETAKAYALGRLYEYLPGKIAQKLKITGQVGTRALGAGLFGGAGAAQTAYEGGDRRQVLSQAIAQGALGTLGGPHERGKSKGVSDPLSEIVDAVPVKSIDKPRLVKQERPEAPFLGEFSDSAPVERPIEPARQSITKLDLENAYNQMQQMRREGRNPPSFFGDPLDPITEARVTADTEAVRRGRLAQRAESGDEWAKQELKRLSEEDGVVDLTNQNVDSNVNDPLTQIIDAVPVKSLDSPKLKKALPKAPDAVKRAHDIAARNFIERRKAERTVERVEREANTDPLTGLSNKRSWTKAKPVAEADPDKSIVMMDIRNAKVFNNNGEEAGDPHFQQAFKALQQAAEENGIGVREVFRVGGDDGAVIAPKAVAEKIVKRAQELYPEKDLDGVRVGLSLGVGNTYAEANKAMKAHKATQGESLRPINDKFTLSAEEVIKNINRLNSGQPDEAATRMLLGNKRYELKEIPVGDVKKTYGRAGINKVREYKKLKPESQPPIVLDGKGDVIDGKHRLKAAKLRGDKIIKAWVPVEEKVSADKVSAPMEVSSKEQTRPTSQVAARKSNVVSEVADKGAKEVKGEVTTETTRKVKELPPERTAAETKALIKEYREAGDSDGIIGNKLGIPESSVDALLPRDPMGQIRGVHAKVEAARKRIAKREAEAKQRGVKSFLVDETGAFDPQAFHDKLLVTGYDIYKRGEAKFKEWSDKMKELHPEASIHALNRVWASLNDGKKPTQQKTTSIKNAVTESERAGRDQEPVEVMARRSFGEVFESGKKAVDNGEINIRALSESWAQKARALKPEESTALLYDRMRLQNEHRQVNEQLSKAIKRGDTESARELEIQREAVEKAIEVNDTAARRTGYEQGLGLAIRKAMIREDYSLANVIQRAKNSSGGKISEKTRAKLEKLTKQYEEIQAKFEESQKRVAELEASKAIKKIDAEVRRTKRSSSRKVLDDEFASLKAEAIALFKENVKNTVNTPGAFGANIDPEGKLTKLVVKMAVNRVKAVGVNTAQVVDDIHEALTGGGIEVSKRDIREAISGYGQVKGPDSSKLAVDLREMKRQLRLALSIEDAQAGTKPPKSGYKHDADTPEVKKMRQELKDAMKKAGLVEPRQPLPPLQGPKLSDANRSGIPKQGPKLSDVNKLKAEGPRLSEAPKQGPPDWLPGAKKRIQKRIDELERRITEKDYEPRKRVQKPLDAEGQALQEHADRLRARLDAEIRSLRPGRGWRNISTARKANLLLSPKTSLRNVAGNTANQVFNELARVPGSIADAALSMITGKRQFSGASVGDSILSMAHAATVGGKEAVDIMKHGATKEQLKQMQFPDEINSGVKVIDWPVKFVFRFMSAQDRLFYQAGYKRNLLDRARTQALNEYRAGKVSNVKNRVSELVKSPTTELEEGARHDALVLTFNNNNKLSDAISRARSALTPFQSAALDIVLPFDRTPTNIIARIVEASPAGYLKNAKQLARAVANKSMTAQEQREFSQTFGRATTGSMLMLLGWKLAAAGLLTSADDKEHPMALKVGSKYVEVGRLSPVGNLLVLGSSLYLEGKKPKAKRSYAKQVGSIPFEQPLLRGVTEIGDVIREPKSSAGRYIAGQAWSFVPGAPILKDVGNLTDKYDRKASTELSMKGIKEQFDKNVPFLRKRLPAKAKK